MSRTISTLIGGFSIAFLVTSLFFFGGPLATLFGIAPILPTGTYWNVEGYFGDSELKLSDGSHYTIGGIGAVTADGRYTVNGDQIVFDEAGPADAPCLHLPGAYSWKINGKLLMLKALDDPCSTRALDWASGDWEYIPPSLLRGQF